MASSAFAQSRPTVPRATRGPFSLTLIVCSGDAPAPYKIEVVGLDGKHIVFRRYSHFIQLRERLLSSGFVSADDLPPLPPKSFFRKNFSKKFMFERFACLRLFFQAVLAIDRFVATDALSDFIAVSNLSVRKQANPRTYATTLSRVSEGLEESVQLTEGLEESVQLTENSPEEGGEDAEDVDEQLDFPVSDSEDSGDEGVVSLKEASPEDPVKPEASSSKLGRAGRVGARMVVIAIS